MRTHLAVAAAAAILATLAACGTPGSAAEKPPTDADTRALFTAEQRANALAEVKDAPLRALIERRLAERERRAAAQGQRLAIETIRVGETIGIGGGMALVRVFALYHEYDAVKFVTYLEGFEALGTNVRLAQREAVGGDGLGLARLHAVDLNRAVLRVFQHAERDERCCPTRASFVVYQLTGFALEPMR